MIPPWLPLRPDLPGRAALVANGRERLAREGLLVLFGPPGVGKTAVAGAIVAGSGRALLAASLLGCEDAADAVRALGEAAGVRPVGDEGALIEALRALGPVDVLVDDVGSEAVLEPAQRAVAATPDARLVIVAEEALLEGGERVDPLDDAVLAELAGVVGVAGAEGSPLLARLAAAFSAPVADALRRLGPAAPLLAAFPVGFGALGATLPAVAAVPDPRDRIVLRRGLAARITPLSDVEACARALPAVEGLLGLARGAHPAVDPDPRDVPLLRGLAARLPGGDDAARCLAAAARLAAIFGQVQVARAMLADRLAAGGPAIELGTLLWADADALAAAGDLEEAERRWSQASAALRRARDGWRAATLHRRAADRLAARGEVALADAHYRQARQLYRGEDEAFGVAATLRGAADLAVAAGEWVSAGTLQEQVAATVDPGGAAPLERANLRLGEASLALARGELGRAARVLDGLGALAADQPLLRANVARRRADLALRRGEHEAAATAARQAAALYAALGEVAAQAGCARLLGDILAAAGRLGEARVRYGEAIRLQVRVQDLRGLARTLDHAAIVAEALGDADEARRLREQRAAAREVV